MSDAAVRERAERILTEYLETELVVHEDVLAVVRDGHRWLVRVGGVQRDFTTIWFTLGDHTVGFDVQFLPAPTDNLERLYELLLLRNRRLYSARYCLTDERDVHLVGRVPLEAVSSEELDRIVGLVYVEAEEFFRRALHLGYASLFPGANG